MTSIHFNVEIFVVGPQRPQLPMASQTKYTRTIFVSSAVSKPAGLNVKFFQVNILTKIKQKQNIFKIYIFIENDFFFYRMCECKKKNTLFISKLSMFITNNAPFYWGIIYDYRFVRERKKFIWLKLKGFVFLSNQVKIITIYSQRSNEKKKKKIKNAFFQCLLS